MSQNPQTPRIVPDMSAGSSSQMVQPTPQLPMMPVQHNAARAPAIEEKQNLQRSFAQSFPMAGVKHSAYEAMMTCIGDVMGFFGTLPFCFCCPNPYRVVQQGSVGIITKFGRCKALVDPGLHQINVSVESIRSVDIKVQITDIPRQAVLTKDNVSVNIDSVLYWEICDPYTATFLVSDVRMALMERTQTTLRHVFGTRTLQDCIEHRETLAHEIESIISGPARSWGAKVEALLLKDILLSPDLINNLSAAATQRRIGESKIIAAEAEVASARLMREAANVLNSPAAMQIRYLETLSTMSKAAGTKVIFMPINQDQNTLNISALEEVNRQ
ncbi:hypothetical protein RI367_003633 [Sorochytrium milnesiophthora]